jgi:hypothetical protein
MFDPARSYDLIGDVHGCALTLEHLLGQREIKAIVERCIRMSDHRLGRD